MPDKKKQRGQRRKLLALLKNTDALLPFQDTTGDYEHFHVPGGMFIQSRNTYGRVKTLFCQKWLDTAEAFIRQKPADLPFCKVVAVISQPHFWDSQLIIFYSQRYYNAFWNRTGPEQTWTALPDNSSFVKARNITTGLSEKGYAETICEDGDCVNSTLWFYGDV